MSIATRDGNWINASRVVKIECSRCGTVKITKHPANDREIYEMIRDHARKHNGIDRGYS